MDEAIPNRNSSGAVLITWSATPWLPAASSAPLNGAHLRIVPPPQELQPPASDAGAAPEQAAEAPAGAVTDALGLTEPEGAVQAALSAGAEPWRVQQLEEQLAASRDEVEALHQMLEDLPEIFERKFRQRLQPLLEHQQALIAENRLLREQVFALGAAVQPQPPKQLPPAREPLFRPVQRLLRVLQRQPRP